MWNVNVANSLAGIELNLRRYKPHLPKYSALLVSSSRGRDDVNVDLECFQCWWASHCLEFDLGTDSYSVAAIAVACIYWYTNVSSLTSPQAEALKVSGGRLSCCAVEVWRDALVSLSTYPLTVHSAPWRWQKGCAAGQNLISYQMPWYIKHGRLSI